MFSEFSNRPVCIGLSGGHDHSNETVSNSDSQKTELYNSYNYFPEY